MILDIAMVAFVLLELSNVIILYFKPEFTYGNSMAVFKGWEHAKTEEKSYLYSKYLVHWVANTKLIFIFLLTTIVLTGNETIKVAGVCVTLVSIGVYFLTLFPIIKRLDALGEITPKGYSKTLSLMIGGFMILFFTALVLHFIFE